MNLIIFDMQNIVSDAPISRMKNLGNSNILYSPYVAGPMVDIVAETI